MNAYPESIRDLPIADKLWLVERIWDDIAASESPLPIPEWALTEAARRRDELLAHPEMGISHEEMWKRIDSHNG